MPEMKEQSVKKIATKLWALLRNWESVNDKIVVLDADLAAATKQEFSRRYFGTPYRLWYRGMQYDGDCRRSCRN